MFWFPLMCYIFVVTGESSSAETIISKVNQLVNNWMVDIILLICRVLIRQLRCGFKEQTASVIQILFELF